MRIVSFGVLATICSPGGAMAGHRAVTVTSMAPGAAIFVDGMQVAVTPARISLPARRGHVITVRGRAGEHTCRLASGAPGGWVIRGLVASRAWLVELVNGRDPAEITECMLPAEPVTSCGRGAEAG
jgi:hypothetical protein